MSSKDSTLKQDILEALEKERNRLNGKKELTPEEDNAWTNVVNFITILDRSSESNPAELIIRMAWNGPLRLS